jgi:hypothetical protein
MRSSCDPLGQSNGHRLLIIDPTAKIQHGKHTNIKCTVRLSRRAQAGVELESRVANILLRPSHVKPYTIHLPQTFSTVG